MSQDESTKKLASEAATFLNSSGSKGCPMQLLLTLLRLGVKLDPQTCNPDVLKKLRLLMHLTSTSSALEKTSLSNEAWMLPTLKSLLLSSSSGVSSFEAPVSSSSAAIQNLYYEEFPSTAVFKQYKDAHVWQEQKEYYQESKMEAWIGNESKVPHAVSSNQMVADQYLTIIVQQSASAVHAKMNQYNKHNIGRARAAEKEKEGENQNKEKKKEEKDEIQVRVAVCEVGAGHGILSFLVARMLQKKSLQVRVQELIKSESATTSAPTSTSTSTSTSASSIDDDGIDGKENENGNLVAYRCECLVVCTDFHSDTFVDLLTLPWVQAACDEGGLDFAVCEAESTDTGIGNDGDVDGGGSGDSNVVGTREGGGG